MLSRLAPVSKNSRKEGTGAAGLGMTPSARATPLPDCPAPPPYTLLRVFPRTNAWSTPRGPSAPSPPVETLAIRRAVPLR
jgi:hypothetical protein